MMDGPDTKPDLRQTVFVVDDDGDVRGALRALLESAGRRVETFDSAENFLLRHSPALRGCLLLDVRMPGMSGVALMERLLAQGDRMPVIFLSSVGDVAIAVRAIKSGAIDFVQKPYDPVRLLETVGIALDVDTRRRNRQLRRADIGARLAALTAREREILDMVTDGRSNKVIARALGISPKTVETHRGRVMLKMGVGSVAELVRTVLEHSEFPFGDAELRGPAAALSR